LFSRYKKTDSAAHRHKTSHGITSNSARLNISAAPKKTKKLQKANSGATDDKGRLCRKKLTMKKARLANVADRIAKKLVDTGSSVMDMS
jgi:hypothetical protein